MAVSYKKLFHLLIKKDLTNARLQQEVDFFANIITGLELTESKPTKLKLTGLELTKPKPTKLKLTRLKLTGLTKPKPTGLTRPKLTGLTRPKLTRLKRDKCSPLENLESSCRVLNCGIENILKFVPVGNGGKENG